MHIQCFYSGRYDTTQIRTFRSGFNLIDEDLMVYSRDTISHPIRLVSAGSGQQVAMAWLIMDFISRLDTGGVLELRTHLLDNLANMKSISCPIFRAVILYHKYISDTVSEF